MKRYGVMAVLLWGLTALSGCGTDTDNTEEDCSEPELGMTLGELLKKMGAPSHRGSLTLDKTVIQRTRRMTAHRALPQFLEHLDWEFDDTCYVGYEMLGRDARTNRNIYSALGDFAQDWPHQDRCCPLAD